MREPTEGAWLRIAEKNFDVYRAQLTASLDSSGRLWRDLDSSEREGWVAVAKAAFQNSKDEMEIR